MYEMVILTTGFGENSNWNSSNVKKSAGNRKSPNVKKVRENSIWNSPNVKKMRKIQFEIHQMSKKCEKFKLKFHKCQKVQKKFKFPETISYILCALVVIYFSAYFLCIEVR